MHQESVAPQHHRDEWETPAFEEIRVSAEVTAYMDILELDGE
ncbi:pyrroloquinoline quinone precursor peptide PqqA [Streptomyces sp. SA15]|nr:pyrroloquinoline quinone precursor peptide PqqA [Streptomyces sp. SA15]